MGWLAEGIEMDLDELVIAAMLGGVEGYLAVEAACIAVEGKAARYAPVLTGRLQGSITHVIGAGDHGVEGHVGSNVEYALYVECGTWKMAPEPYLRPALKACGLFDSPAYGGVPAEGASRYGDDEAVGRTAVARW